MGNDRSNKKKGKQGEEDKIKTAKDYLNGISTLRTGDFTNDMHFDYLVKKNYVLELEGQTPQEDAKKVMNQRLFVKKYELNKSGCTLQTISDTVFAGKHPLNEYRNLCQTLGWISDTIFMNSVEKVIVGLGNTNINEVSMTIHHTYGIPYIPGQAVKGVFRNYFIMELIDKKGSPLQICGKAVEPEKLYKLIFGEVYDRPADEDHVKGSVVFFDVFPWNQVTVAKDIMTPHYYQYYGDKPDGKRENPVDSIKPLPIEFYVLKGATMAFHFAIRKEFLEAYPFIAKDEVACEGITLTELCRFLKEKLADALEKYGIGAKTSVGYGAFTVNREVDESERKKYLRKVQEREEAIREKREQEKMAKMTEVERLLYCKSQLSDDQKKGEIPGLIKDIERWNESDQKKIAEFVKRYYEEEKRWNTRSNDKTMEKFAIIRRILGENA